MIGDIATVRDGFQEGDKHARLDGKPMMMVTVYRVGNEDDPRVRPRSKGLRRATPTATA
ncbi:MAG: hypothetical protein U5O39_14225 [Gammaproteobacteria bacterium]|nr:hypothetical protein [Gammaproteobacteria bacterium]